MALNPSVNMFHVDIYSPACYLQWEQKVLTPISSIQLPAEMVKAIPPFTYSIALWMFIGSSSTGSVISMDLCKCLKGANLKRELSLPGSAGICGWVWLAFRSCVDFRDRNKKRKKKKSSPSAHSAPSVLRDAHVSCVLEPLWQQEQGGSWGSDHGQMWGWTCSPRSQLSLPDGSCVQTGAGTLTAHGSSDTGDLVQPAVSR